jgi:hypothetical protein
MSVASSAFHTNVRKSTTVIVTGAHLDRETTLNVCSLSLRSPPKFGTSLLPGWTPIRKTFPLTPEFLAMFSHSSAALWTYTVQNAGDHVGARPGSI